MERTHFRRFTPVVVAIISTYPVSVLFSLYLLTYRWRLRLGHWPEEYEIIPPPSLSADWHFAHIKVGLITSPFVTLFCIVWIIIARQRWDDFPIWKLLFLSALCLVLQWLILSRDPSGLLRWFSTSWW
jgi:hypothetical protein